MTKQFMRQWAKDQVSRLSDDEKKAKSKVIVSTIDSWLRDTRGDDEARIFMFCGMKTEPMIMPLLQSSKNRRFALPRILGPMNMEFRYVTAESELAMGVWSIEEPLPSYQMVVPTSLDIMLVPCVAVTREGIRLGHGRGYYDRYISSLKERPLLVAVAFSDVIAASGSWEHQAHDVAVQEVISDLGHFNVEQLSKL